MADPLAGTIEFQITGTSALIAKLQQIKAQLGRQIAGASYLVAQEVLEASARLVPVDTGTLQASGYVGEPEISADSISVHLGYGGMASAYAWNQEYGGWINLRAWGHDVGPYWPMSHPPKWATEVLAHAGRHNARIVAK
ncbi:MAG: hypothetical protein ACREHV_06555, partial [Rhizomicrobium sp.]